MNLYLQNAPLKIKRKIEHIFDNKHVKLLIPRNSLLFPVFDASHGVQVGWLLAGKLKFSADLLVHTSEGVTGKVIEQTYSYALLMPPLLDFMSFSIVKEIRPVPDTSPYAQVLATFNRRIVNIDFIIKPSPHTFVWCYDPSSFWLISKKETLHIALPEVIARSGDDKFLWLNKKGLVFVDRNKKSFNSSELFSGKTVRRFIAELVGSLQVDNFLKNFRHFS
ncbi:MAG: hypothetical protein ACTSQE_02620 [Candidatus Heimdallarchaeaceae archaeon]